MKIRFLTQAAIIGALYTVLTLAFAPVSFGQVQVRVAEMLTILPALTPAAIPGLFVGCLVANIYSGEMLDIIFGSLATLTAAVLSYKMPKKWLVPLPPVLVNAVVVGIILKYVYRLPFPLIVNMGLVAAGQLVACYGLGYPLLLQLEKYKNKLFNKR